MNTVKDTIQYLTIQLEEKSETLSQLEKKRDIFHSEIDNKNKEITDILNEKLQLQKEITLKCEELKQTCIQGNSLYLGLYKKTAEFSDLSKQIPLIHVEHSNIHDDLQQGIEKTQIQMSELKEELVATKNRLEETRLELLDSAGEKSELKFKIQELEETIGNLDIKLKEQAESIIQKNTVIECLKQNISAENIEIGVSEIENKNKIHEITKKSEILEEKVQDYEEQLASKESKIQFYKNNLYSKKCLIKQLSNEIELLNEKITSYESHIDALANQIEAQPNQIHSLQSDNAYANNSTLIINSEEKLMTPGKEKTIPNKSNLIAYENQIRTYKQLCKQQIDEVASLKLKIYSSQIKYEDLKTTLNVIQDVVIFRFDEYSKINDNKIVTQLIHDTGKAIEILKTQITEETESSPEILRELITNYSEKVEHFKLNENKLEANKLLLEQKQNEVVELTYQLSKIEKSEIVYENMVRERDAKKEILNQKLMEYQDQQKHMVNNIETLKQQIISKTNELEKFLQQDTNLELNKQLVEGRDQEITLLCEEILKCEHELQNYGLHAKTLTKILNSTSTFLKKKNELNDTKDREIDTLKGALNEKINKYEQCMQEITDLNNKINKLNIEVQDLKKENNNSITQKDIEITALKEALNNEKQKYEQQIHELNIIQEEFIVIKSQNFHEENNALNLQVEQLKEQMKEKELYVKELEEKIKYLENLCIEIDILKSNCLQNEILNKEYSSHNQRLTEELNKTTLELKVFKDMCIDKEKEVEAIKESLKNKDLEINKISEELKQKNNKLSVLKNEIFAANVKKDETELQNEILNKEYNSRNQRLTEELNKTTFELKVFKDTYIDKEKEIKAIKESLENKDLEINKISEELKQKNKELSVLKNEIFAANVKKNETEFRHNKEIQKKQNEINQLNDKLGSLAKRSLNENFVKELNSNLKTQMHAMEKYKQLVETVNIYSKRIENCNKAVNFVRSQIDITKNSLKIKEEQLNVVLGNILKYIKPKCEISTDVDIETFRAQCKVAFSTNEVKKLRHENTEYKALVSKIRAKANSQLGNFQNILANVHSENEKLKINASTNEALIKSLEEKVQNLQTEINKTSDGSSSYAAALQSKITTLKKENKELKDMGNYLQEQTTQKISELKEYRKKLEFLKRENSELLKSSSDYVHIKKQLTVTEASLKTAQATIKQLEMEKDNLNATSRNLEESLEDVKFELFTLKNKERERVIKHKRRSLHDSSRVLSEVDEPAASEQLENLQNVKKIDANKQNKENAQINTDSKRCKKRDIECQTEELNTQICALKDEVEKWRNKFNICKDLCSIRKRKIEELEVKASQR